MKIYVNLEDQSEWKDGEDFGLEDNSGQWVFREPSNEDLVKAFGEKGLEGFLAYLLDSGNKTFKEFR